MTTTDFAINDVLELVEINQIQHLSSMFIEHVKFNANGWGKHVSIRITLKGRCER